MATPRPLATYFATLADSLRTACQLPVAGLHIDAVRAPEDLVGVLDWLPGHKVLSLGVVDGRNIWRAAPAAARRRQTPGHTAAFPSFALPAL